MGLCYLPNGYGIRRSGRRKGLRIAGNATRSEYCRATSAIHLGCRTLPLLHTDYVA